MACHSAISAETAPNWPARPLFLDREAYSLSRGERSRGAAPRVKADAF